MERYGKDKEQFGKLRKKHIEKTELNLRIKHPWK